jgi:DNA-binding HxlR family transcriptional regulator
VKRTRFDDWPCPIARTTDLIGDWWTPLVMREAFLGRKRFDDFVQALGIPRAVLAARLDRLVREDMLRTVEYEAHPPRHEYKLTAKGIAFYDVLAAMWRWGSDWQWTDGEPTLMLVDRDSGEEIVPVVVNERTGDRIDVRRLRVRTRRGRAAPA